MCLLTQLGYEASSHMLRAKKPWHPQTSWSPIKLCIIVTTMCSPVTGMQGHTACVRALVPPFVHSETCRWRHSCPSRLRSWPLTQDDHADRQTTDKTFNNFCSSSPSLPNVSLFSVRSRCRRFWLIETLAENVATVFFFCFLWGQ